MSIDPKAQDPNTDPPKPLTRAEAEELFKALFEPALSGVTKKVNAELGDRRRELEALQKAIKPANGGGDGGTPDPKSEPKGLTLADLEAAQEVGEMAAQLPPETRQKFRERFKGKSLLEQRDALELLLETHGGRDEESTKSKGRDARQNNTTRGAPTPPRDTPGHPQSMDEYIAQTKDNPKRKAELSSDDTFRLEDLPRRRRSEG